MLPYPFVIIWRVCSLTDNGIESLNWVQTLAGAICFHFALISKIIVTDEETHPNKF